MHGCEYCVDTMVVKRKGWVLILCPPPPPTLQGAKMLKGCRVKDCTWAPPMTGGHTHVLPGWALSPHKLDLRCPSGPSNLHFLHCSTLRHQASTAPAFDSSATPSKAPQPSRPVPAQPRTVCFPNVHNLQNFNNHLRPPRSRLS